MLWPCTIDARCWFCQRSRWASNLWSEYIDKPVSISLADCGFEDLVFSDTLAGTPFMARNLEMYISTQEHYCGQFHAFSSKTRGSAFGIWKRWWAYGALIWYLQNSWIEIKEINSCLVSSSRWECWVGMHLPWLQPWSPDHLLRTSTLHSPRNSSSFLHFIRLSYIHSYIVAAWGNSPRSIINHLCLHCLSQPLQALVNLYFPQFKHQVLFVRLVQVTENGVHGKGRADWFAIKDNWWFTGVLASDCTVRLFLYPPFGHVNSFLPERKHLRAFLHRYAGLKDHTTSSVDITQLCEVAPDAKCQASCDGSS